MSAWYRVHQSADPGLVFSGDGGLFVSGRWNHKGKRAIYCSQSIALATMEWLSHNGLSVSGFSYYRYSIEVPDHLVTTVQSHELPEEWAMTPAIDATRDFSEFHLFSSGKRLGLRLPSVLVPEEQNLILNPLHSDFAKVATTIKSLGRYSAPARG